MIALLRLKAAGVWLLRELRRNPSSQVLALLFLFMFFPGVDLGISGWFYQPGAGFAVKSDNMLGILVDAQRYVILGAFVFCIVLWVGGIWYEQWFWGVTTPKAVYLMMTLVAGPGLLVEALLKPNWGRARPNDISLFGGPEAYTPPLWVANACTRNCSFVSGHAAIAFWVSAFGFLLPAKWRAAGVLAGVAFGGAMGFIRVAEGEHFLSDVVFAGLIVLGVNYALYRLTLARDPQA